MSTTVAAIDSWQAIDALVGFISDAPKKTIGRDHDEILYGRARGRMLKGK